MRTTPASRQKGGRDQAVVLLSGGLDSATALYWARKVKKWRCHCLLLDYGQRHRWELRSAKGIARAAGCRATLLKIRLPWGGSSLLGEGKIPHHLLTQIGRGKIPSTYVPARNTVFLSLALSWADAVGARRLVIGANALDYSGYPDCRPAYLRAFEKAARLGTRLGTEERKKIFIEAPLVRLSKAQIIRKGLALGVPYEKTWSCYGSGRVPCGQCDSCQLRRRGFQEAGHADPARAGAARRRP